MNVGIVGGGVNGLAIAWQLLKDGHKVTLATREYAIFKNKSLINIYGGKWTTCRALAKKVARKIN